MDLDLYVGIVPAARRGETRADRRRLEHLVALREARAPREQPPRPLAFRDLVARWTGRSAPVTPSLACCAA